MIIKQVIYVLNLIKMDLSLKDRVIILNTVLPLFDNRRNVRLKMSISEKIALGTEEQNKVVVTAMGGGQYDVSFKSVEALTQVKAFDFTDHELMYLKERIDFLDKDGMFSADTMETYLKILDQSFLSPEMNAKWKAMSNE